MGKVVDVIHNTALSTYEEKKSIDVDDPSHKDVMSVLRKLVIKLGSSLLTLIF
jgi:hypothetical protein